MNWRSFVYVIGSPGLAEVKIGVSGKPRRRAKQLQPDTDAPLSVLWYTHGDGYLERALHLHFADYWTHGEWFDLTTLGDPVKAVQEAKATVRLTLPRHSVGYCLNPEDHWGSLCLCS